MTKKLELVRGYVEAVYADRGYGFAAPNGRPDVFFYLTKGRAVLPVGDVLQFTYTKEKAVPQQGDRLYMMVKCNTHGSGRRWSAELWGFDPTHRPELDPDRPVPSFREFVRRWEGPERESITLTGADRLIWVGMARTFAVATVERLLKRQGSRRTGCPYLALLEVEHVQRLAFEVGATVQLDDLLASLPGPDLDHKHRSALEELARGMIRHRKRKPFRALALLHRKREEEIRRNKRPITIGFSTWPSLRSLERRLREAAARRQDELIGNLLQISRDKDFDRLERVWDAPHCHDWSFSLADRLVDLIPEWVEVGEVELLRRLYPLLQDDEGYESAVAQIYALMRGRPPLERWQPMAGVVTDLKDRRRAADLYHRYVLQPGLQADFLTAHPELADAVKALCGSAVSEPSVA